MTLNPAIVAQQANDAITREQLAFAALQDRIRTNIIVVAYSDYLAAHAVAQGRITAAATAGITLTGVATEPTLPSASLTAASDSSGAPSLLSVIAAVITTTVTARQAQDAGVQAYQDAHASS